MVAGEPFLGSVPTGDRRVSGEDFSVGTLRVDASLFVAGDFARFAESMNHCLIEESWLMMAS